LKYSGKAKCHTEKALVWYSTNLNKVIAVSTSYGSKHDFDIFKQSKTWIKESVQNTLLLADSGFQGITKYLKNCLTPFKKPRNGELTKDEKWWNKTLAQERVKIENINREIKIFKICNLRRRHKQKKFNLFWNLISGIVNFKLNY
jgi:DDE superfamily endonuclease